MSTEERAFRFEVFQILMGLIQTREETVYGDALVASGYVFEDSKGYLLATSLGATFIGIETR